MSERVIKNSIRVFTGNTYFSNKLKCFKIDNVNG